MRAASPIAFPIVPPVLAALALCAAPLRAQSGHLVAFTAALRVDLDGAELGGIHVVRPDGSGLRQITQFHTVGLNWEQHGFNLPDDHPDVSPDGRRIVFASNRAGQALDWDLWWMDVNGGGVEPLSLAPGLDIEPVFSPDGTRIAFASERFSGNLDICVLDLATRGVVRLTSSPLEEIEPAWSPDGTRIAFTVVQGFGQKDVFTMRADGGDRRQITFADGEDHDAKFSPDGTRLAITSERAFSPPYGDVWLIHPVSGGNAINLTDDLSFGAGDPSWSPDGGHIAFFHSSLPVITGPQRLFVMRSDGSDKRQMPNAGLLNIHPNWGVVADTDQDGRADYLENSNRSHDGRDFGTEGAGDRFGAALALADLTRDGFPELAIGAPGFGTVIRPNTGAVHLARGSQFGLDFGLFGLAGPGLPQRRVDAAFFGETTLDGGRFGATLASGDFNDDGFTDLAIGAPGHSIVCVMYGASGPRQVLRGSGAFGSALAVGDFDRNGVDDLAVGAPQALRQSPLGNVAAGAVHVFFGVQASGLAASAQVIGQSTLPDVLGAGSSEAGDEFGAALAAGDFNGDGASDLAIGVPGEGFPRLPQAGLVHVVPGALGLPLRTDLAIARDARSLPSPHTGTRAGARFGEVLASGDFNKDLLRMRDLVVGVPRQRVGTVAEAGIVAVFPARVGGELLGAPSVFTAADLGGGGNAQRFGNTLATGDFTGDTIADLAIAAPGADAGNAQAVGQVWIVHGNRGTNQSCAFCAPGTVIDMSAGGLLPSSAQAIVPSQVGSPGDAGSRFGGGLLIDTPNALATGDLDQDGQDELFVGIPEQTVRGKARAGRIGIRYGVRVGTFELTPARADLAVGDEHAVALTWTHPRAWREMDSIELRLVDDDGAFLWLRFDERAGTLRLLEPRSGRFGRAVVPGHGWHGSPWAMLRAERTRVIGGSTGARSVTLELALRFLPPARGRTYRVELLATDDAGHAQGFVPAGEWRIVGRP